MKNIITIGLTGAAGQIGYALLPRIASGEMFGPDQPLRLRLIDIEAALPALRGTIMEIEDGAYPLVRGITATSSYYDGFLDADWALLIGGKPRGPGMERKDLLAANAAIIRDQARALDECATRDAKVFVVANPCNTNCMVAIKSAPQLHPENFFAMTRLDQNRARTRLAQRAGVGVEDVEYLAIWGNHSATQYPDGMNARIGGAQAADVVGKTWLQNDFVRFVQQRGAEVIKARGASSAMSAANAIVGSVRSIITPTPLREVAALAVASRGEYGVPEGLVFGYPVVSDGASWKVAEGFEHNDAAKGYLDATIKELLEERKAVASFL